ncbi:MAG: Flp family type IVb pilin [Rhodoferax sp.]|jgi:pilus assembly protein Flp/PilA|nr:Flp family type IVb pilin [Rhodoferax sp.]
MKNLYNGIRKFAKDEEGATAVEYGMMVGLVAVAIIVAVAAIGTQLNVLFGKIKTCITTPASCT